MSNYKQREKVLCQDCLRVEDFTQAKHVTESSCVCGGDMCGCPSCMDTVNKLNAGYRKAKDIGCQIDVTLWSEKNGLAEVAL